MLTSRPATRHALVCAALTVLAFLQSPGLVVADSKIDLAVNPVGFLARAIHVWDPSGSFGQIQNQAYGYLWPMGPFFTAGTGVGLPAWAVQRLWWALLLCVAYTGAVLLAQRLGIGTPVSRLVGGVAFALSPRILTELGALSVEAWPSAVAPWVLIPLVGLRDGSTSLRRAVTLSALAVACAGGVNATAVFAVVPLAALWLLGLSPTRWRLVALAAWGAAVLAATLWWLVPLLVLGRYSPPFLDYIETAHATTGVTDPVTVVRGASHWLGWLTDNFGVSLPAGFQIATEPVIVAATVILAAIGLAGLARRGMPHRRFLTTGLLLGFALVSLGHVGDLPGTFAGAQREFLDGIGAPLRNVHKFDVLLRLPLILGLAHVLGLALRARPVRRRPAGTRATRRPRAGSLATAGVLTTIAVAATPAWTGALAAPNGFTDVPGYWREAAAWLEERADDGRVLVIPGARFPNYTWGDTLDEITQPLLRQPWAVRNAIPMAQPGAIRMMDAIESVLTTGQGSPGLADYLARAGVRYLLVRNDLDFGRSGVAAPALVQQALQRSPGLVEEARFGPTVFDAGDPSADGGLGVPVPALQVLRVPGPTSRAVAYPASSMTTVVGGPESLLALAEADLLPPGPAVLAGDLGSGAAGPVVLTDGLRRRTVSFGTGRDSVSQTLTAGQPARDYLPAWGARWQTTVAYDGIADVSASSSAAQPDSIGGARPEHQPFAALDGDPATAWRPSPGLRLEGQWWQVTLRRAERLGQLVVSFDETAGALPSRVTVDTGTGRSTMDVIGSRLVIPLSGTTPVRTIRLTVERVQYLLAGGTIGIAAVEIPGVTATRTLVVPPAPAGTTDPVAVVLRAAPEVPGCFFPDQGVRCNPTVARASEDGPGLDRRVVLPVAAGYTPAILARPRSGPALDALLDSLVGAQPQVVASSRWLDEPVARPGVVLDGDPGTVWWPSLADQAPTLTLTWPAPRTVTGLLLATAPGVTATPVAAVTVTAAGVSRTALLVDGTVTFDEPLWTDRLTVRLIAGNAAHTWDPYLNVGGDLPVGVGELTVLPATAAGPAAPLELACGTGPTLSVDGVTVRTRLVADHRDLLQRREVPAVACDGSGALELAAGEHRIVADPSELSTATRVTLLPPSTGSASPEPASPEPASAEPVTPQIGEWSATRRTLTLAPHDEELILAVRENTNPGWRAAIGGTVLTPIVVDGWQQGWLVPAGLSGEIVLTFVPEDTYRTGLVGGAVALALVVLLAIAPSRWFAPLRRPRAFAAWSSWPRGSRGAGTGRTEGRVLPFLVGGVALVFAAGVLGLIVVMAGVGVLAAQNLREGPGARVLPLWRHLRHWLPPALLIAAGLMSLTLTDLHRNVWPQTTAILALALVWLSTATFSPRPSPGDRGPMRME